MLEVHAKFVGMGLENFVRGMCGGRETISG